MFFALQSYMRVFLPITMIFGLLLGGCGAGGPSMPTQLPTTVEYAGTEIGGDVAVQTGKTATFVAKDADGNVVDPSLITTEIVSDDGSVIDYGAFSVIDNQLKQSIPAYFPNTESKYIANFYYDPALASMSSVYKADPSTLLSSIPVYVSVSEDDFSLGDYILSDAVDILSDYATGALKLHRTDNNILFMSVDTVVRDGPHGNPVTTTLRLMKKPDAYNNTWEGPYDIVTVEYGSDRASVSGYCGLDSYDTDAEGNEKVALAWTVDRDEGPFRESKTIYLAYSNDGGMTFGSPIIVDEASDLEDLYKMGYPQIAFDRSGLLHIVYFYMNESSQLSARYKYCSESSCSDAHTINSVPGTVEGTPFSMGLSNGDGVTNVYVAWVDLRDTHQFMMDGSLHNTNDVFMGTVVYNNGSVEVRADQKANSEQDGSRGLPSISVDRESNPVLVWQQATSTDGSDRVQSIAFVKYLASALSFRNTIIASDASDVWLLENYPSVSADTSNYYHISYIYNPIVGGVRVNAERRMSYLMGKYVEGSEDTLQTIEKDVLMVNNPDEDINRVQQISDHAGRIYLVWSYDWGNGVYYIEGNIPTSAEN